MTTRKQPMVTLRLSRFVILCLALVAAGAVAHDWLAGRAMWEFYRAEAAVLVAEAEKAFGANALEAIRQVDRAEVLKARLAEGEAAKTRPRPAAVTTTLRGGAIVDFRECLNAAGNLWGVGPRPRTQRVKLYKLTVGDRVTYYATDKRPARMPGPTGAVPEGTVILSAPSLTLSQALALENPRG